MKGATSFVVIVLITVLRACQCKGIAPNSGGENLQRSSRNPASSWRLTRPRFPPKIPFKSSLFLKKRTLKLPDNKSKTPQREKRAKKNVNSSKRRRPPFSDLLQNFQPTTVQSKLQDYEFGDLTRWLLLEESKARSRKRAAPVSVLARPEWYTSTNQQQQHKTEEEEGTTPGALVEDLTMKTSTFGAVFLSSWRSLRSVILVFVIKWIVALKMETFVLRRLPISILVELLHLCAQQETRPQIVRIVGTELDKRLKLMLTGDEDYEFGDLTKRAVAGFTGQSTYRFGDITKSILVKAKAKTDQVALLRQLDVELNELERYIASEKPSHQWPFFRRFSSRS